MKYNPDKRKLVSTYPWIHDPQKNNIKAAVAKMKSTEIGLKKMRDAYTQKHQNEMDDRKRRNVARKLSEDDMQLYDGPVYSITHHEVLMTRSPSIPLRIVFNASAECMGQGLNEWWAKGPDVINNLCGVVGGFKQERVASVDVAKMYHSVKLIKLDQQSDNETQLVAASKILKDIMKEWDMEEILSFGSYEGMRWHFNTAADAPWYNGACESLVRLVKGGLTRAIGESILTFGELQTVMYEIANLINERPIGIKPGSCVDLGCYLCPNELFLGKASVKTPSGIFGSKEDPNKTQFVTQLVDGFWRKWQRYYFPTLLTQSKWYCLKRNVKVGDIVLVQDPNAVQGVWKLAQVMETKTDNDALIRTVQLRYKTLRAGNNYAGVKDRLMWRSIHRLVMLVPVEEQ